MVDLVTLEQAKRNLRIPLALTDDDGEVALLVSHASDLILNYLKSRAEPDWESDSVPPRVQLATLLFVTHFYENRGSDMRADETTWGAVKRILERDRDPAWA